MKQLLLFFLLLKCSLCLCQDTHYWTYRFGTKAALMGGPAVGGIEDNSSVVYNPSLLSFVKNTSVSLNANIYQIANILAKNGAGTGLDVYSNQFSVVPTTISVLVPRRKNSRFTMGYAIIVPTEFNFKASARMADTLDIVDNIESPGPEEYVGQFTINSRLTENMGAFAIAYRLSNCWSIGVTNQIIYRSHSYSKTELARMILNNLYSSLVSTSETQNIEYVNLRYVAKLGIAFKSGYWSGGLVVSSPSLVAGGSGTIARDITATNLQVNLQTNPTKPPVYVRTNLSANDRQSQLKTTYKSPLTIAAGVAYTNKKTTVAISAEWFNSVPLYNIMSPQDNLFKRPTNLALNGKLFMEINASNKSVLNAAIGFHREIKPTIAISGGFRINRSFYDRVYDNRVIQTTRTTLSNIPLNLDISSWDIYHVVLGATFSRERKDISIGINYSWASEGSLKQFANFDQPTESSFLLGQQSVSQVYVYSYGILLGYTFRFRSENNKK